jgi:hypothetical protein
VHKRRFILLSGRESEGCATAIASSEPVNARTPQPGDHVVDDDGNGSSVVVTVLSHLVGDASLAFDPYGRAARRMRSER